MAFGRTGLEENSKSYPGCRRTDLQLRERGTADLASGTTEGPGGYSYVAVCSGIVAAVVVEDMSVAVDVAPLLLLLQLPKYTSAVVLAAEMHCCIGRNIQVEMQLAWDHFHRMTWSSFQEPGR